MRADMFKVIVERPRSGSRVRWSSGDRRYLNSEDAPPKLGIRRGHLRRKWLNEHLGPLRRFLVRQAGRPWNAVFSEICAVIDNRSTVKQHVRSHIEDFVAIKTKLVDGKIYETGGYSAVYTPLSEARQPLYVDPETGVLMRNQERVTRAKIKREQMKRRRAEIESRRRVLSGLEELHRVHRVWYFVRLALLPMSRKEMRLVNGERREFVIHEKRWDVLCKAYVSSKECNKCDGLYARHGAYAVAKRQLGSRELRRYGLR